MGAIIERKARRIAKKNDCYITKSRERSLHSNDKGVSRSWTLTRTT